MKPTAAIYARVSSDSQENNFSTASQIEACERYAQQHGLEVIGVFSDVASGSTIERPQLERLRDLVRQREITALVVYSSDRLTRNVAQGYLLRDDLKRYGVALHYVTRGQSQDSAEGNLFEVIDSAFAEYERLKIAERLERGRKRKVQEGKLIGCGPSPYGYRWTGDARTPRLILHSEEADIVKLIFKWYTNDGLSLKGIAQRLNTLGVSAPMGLLWYQSTVAIIVRNPVYTGVYHHWRKSGNSVIVEDSVEALISSAAFSEAQRKLSTNKGVRAKRFYLLSGRARTERSKLWGWLQKTGKYEYRCYKESESRGFRPLRVKAPILDDATWQGLVRMLTPEAVRVGLERLKQEQAGAVQERVHQVETLLRERANVEARHKKMVAAYQADAISIEDLRESKERTQFALASIDNELDQLKHADGTMFTDEDEQAMLALVENVHTQLDHVSDEDKAHIVAALDVQVMIISSKKNALAFRCDTLIGSFGCDAAFDKHNLTVSYNILYYSERDQKY
ncbi:MAG: recombinase family protein [Chloroflexaceae bacterium]|nr:recombinase family protein [Chloroflexaceae bacterium]